MMIRSLRDHFPARKIEWIMGGFLLVWGIYVLLHPELFTQPATAQALSGLTVISLGFTSYPALFWGGIAFVTGLARCVALFVNGVWTRTPLIRLIASFVSMFVITQILIGLWRSGVPNTGLVAYPWFIVADLLSAYRAAVDVVYAQKQRELNKETRRARRHDTRLPA